MPKNMGSGQKTSMPNFITNSGKDEDFGYGIKNVKSGPPEDILRKGPMNTPEKSGPGSESDGGPVIVNKTQK